MNQKPDPQQEAALQLELQQRQALLEEATAKLAQVLFQHTGLPPQAIIVVVHWPNDIQFASRITKDATPQAAMNAIDAMLKHVRTVGEKMKAGINMVRHGAKPGEEKH